MGRREEAGEGAAIPPALALMTDSSEDEEEIEEEEKDLLSDEKDLTRTKLRGRFIKMSFFKNKSVWFVWDPCGIVCAVMTYFLVMYGEFVMLTVIAPPFPGTWTALNVLVFSSLGALAVVAHVRSMLTDPVSDEEEGGRERRRERGGRGG